MVKSASRVKLTAPSTSTRTVSVPVSPSIVSCDVSVFVELNTMVSSLAPPLMLSLPAPEMIESAPAPLLIVSLPAPPMIVSASRPPPTENLPFVSAEPSNNRLLPAPSAAALIVNVAPASTRPSSVVIVVSALPSVTVSIPVTLLRSSAAPLASVNVSVSVPVPPSTVSDEVRLPAKTMVSSLAPPLMLSAPAPAVMLSLPAPPATVSSPAPVVMVSLSAPPRTSSASFAALFDARSVKVSPLSNDEASIMVEA